MSDDSQLLSERMTAYANALTKGPFRDLLRSAHDLADEHGLSDVDRKQALMGIVLGLAVGAARDLGVDTPDAFAGLARDFASLVGPVEDVIAAATEDGSDLELNLHVDGSVVIVTTDPEPVRH